MLRIARTCLLLATALAVMTPLDLHGQATMTNASVTGRVTDPSGAVMPHAAIKALAIATNQTYTVQSDLQGRFRFSYLPIGEYRVSVQADGFSEASRKVQLTIGS